MPAFPKPKFSYHFELSDELDKLKKHKTKRNIPKKQTDKLLIASWNIANLGLQDRQSDHNDMIAEIISWFDVIAIQEVNNNLKGLKDIESLLPSHYDLIFSDTAGNNERSAFIYDNKKVEQLELVGEVAIAPKDHRYIKIKGIDSKFTGFDRNPYLCSFQWSNFTFILITVHSYFGKAKNKASLERRALEAYAIARYADLRRKSKFAFSKNIITLGDFNIPKVSKDDMIYKALRSRGLMLPEHSTTVYSNINNDKQYDQIAFLPALKSKIESHGVFDFDNVVFSDLYDNDNTSKKKDFKKYVKYYLSDHRPLWMQIKL